MENSGKRVFLTGASGFIASTILSLLIERGYQTTASVRSEPKAQQILNKHPTWKGKVHFVYVADIAVDGAFDEIFQQEKIGFDYILHTASPVNFSVTDFQKDLIDPAVRGTTCLLACAHERGGPQLKRFVLLGSAVAVLDSSQDISCAGKPYSEKDWNTVTAASAIESKSAVLGYNASKKLAEQAAWEFLSKKKPVFDLTVINPDVIIGPMFQPIKGPENVNETNSFAIYDFLNGKCKNIENIYFPFYHFVDVRDVALAHLLSLTNPSAANQRILLVSGLITPQLVINIIRARFPALRERIVEGKPGQVFPRGVQPTGWDTSKSQAIFGRDWQYTDLETSVVDTVNCLLELEESWGK